MRIEDFLGAFMVLFTCIEFTKGSISHTMGNENQRNLQTTTNNSYKHPQKEYHNDTDPSDVINLMNIIIKTPGRCQLDDSFRGISQSLGGERQDFLLGQYVKSDMGVAIGESVKRERQVYSLSTNSLCHWKSLQTFCRSLLMGIEQPEVESSKNEILFPPGSDSEVFKDGYFEGAVPSGFFPVAIRNDNLGQVLIDDMSLMCPDLEFMVKHEERFGVVKNLSSDSKIKQRMIELDSKLKDELKNYPFPFYGTLRFENMEQIYKELEYKGLTLTLSEDTMRTLSNLYWLHIYAKYTANKDLLVSLVKPTIDLLLEKISYLSRPDPTSKTEKDRLVVLSISDRLMAGLNAFFFHYSFECFKEFVVSGDKTNSLCPGKIMPTSNIIFKIDQVVLKEKVIALLDGGVYDICGPNCNLNDFENLLKNRIEQAKMIVPCKFKRLVILSGFFDRLMAKVVVLLFVVLVYYVVRYGFFLSSGVDYSKPIKFYKESKSIKPMTEMGEAEIKTADVLDDEDVWKINVNTV